MREKENECESVSVCVCVSECVRAREIPGPFSFLKYFGITKEIGISTNLGNSLSFPSLINGLFSSVTLVVTRMTSCVFDKPARSFLNYSLNKERVECVIVHVFEERVCVCVCL